MIPSIAAVSALIAAHASPDQPGATLRALDAALAETPGYILFTILAHDLDAQESTRVHSSHPIEYPVGGRKPVTQSAWMRRVVHNGEPWIGYDAHAIRGAFFDHATILALGCESVLNMPVRWRGETVGTLNLLHRAGHYNDAQLPQVALLAHLALPALLIGRT